MTNPHIPVLLSEVVKAFNGVHLASFVDGTVGAGGHSAAIAEEHPELERHIGIDQDPQARQLAKERLSYATIVEGNFRELGELVEGPVDGILLDIGVSSMQVDQAERGFSFMQDAPLDMRMDPTNPLNAHTILNEWDEADLRRILKEYGEIRGPIAKRLVENRPIETTGELAKLVPHHLRAQLFQAIRIAVNDELGAIESVLPVAIEMLAPGGRLAVITFHSLEDRIVKNAFAAAAKDWEADPVYGRRPIDPVVKLVTKKPIVASEAEVKRNVRARSAKLRVIEKL